MKQFLLGFLLFFSLGLFAQKDYIDCTVKLVNDTVKTGKCTMPEFPTDNGIFFKQDDLEREYLKSNTIKHLEIRRKERSHRFDFLPVAVYKKRHDSIVEDVRKYWLYLKFSTEHMNTYVKAHSYNIDWRGELNLKSTNLVGNHPIVYYLKRKNDSYAFHLMDFSTGWFDERAYNKNLFYYFRSETKFYQLLKGKQISWKRINEIPVYYTWYKNQMYSGG